MHWIALQPTPDALGDACAPADLHTALAWGALRFTPLVARVNGALVLEVSASERLFGGRAALLRRFYMQNKAVAPICQAQGATSLIALGRLWSGSPQVSVDALPVKVLAAAQPHLPTLVRLGVRTWGQLRALPRGGLVRRFGAGLLDALDQAYGQRAEVYPWITLPDVLDVRLELAASVESAPALLFGARRLLAQLLVWLRTRNRGVLSLELVWELDARRANAQHVDIHHSGGQQGRMALHTAQPTQDMQHLQRLLAEQLARVTLPAPVLYLRLRTLQTQSMAGESKSLLPEDQRKGDSLHQTLERLGARLGKTQVQSVQPFASHVPERMQCWAPWAAETAPKSGAAYAYSARPTGHFDGQLHAVAGLYPTWLLPTPLQLQVHAAEPWYHGALELLAGPQRLETGWLEGTPVLRDYFVARSTLCGLLWIYRERLQAPQGHPRWYLHGLFA
jgi:protein ImuB